MMRWIVGLVALCACLARGGEISVVDDSPQVQFAVSRLKPELKASKAVVTFKLNESLGEQAYSIKATKANIGISGGDPVGLMYGGLELAEQLKLGNDVSKLSLIKEPFIKRRGLKMNIPLDARSPSYDDSGTSARKNVEQVWSKDFWHGHLDRMAEHRYNTVTLWCNHPFSAMLELEKYPDVALHDVAVPTYELDDHMLPQYMEKQLQDPKNYKIIKKMPMSEKVAFWQHVMRYAKERGIDIYFITWNIWVHGAEGKYGINSSQTNPKTVEYLRESVKQFVLTYPDLKGIGITCGEHMQNKLEGENSVEKWMWKTYGLGVVDAKKEQPGREVHFIHRIWYSDMQVIMDDFIAKYPDPIDLGFKYARARLYSMPNPPFFDHQLRADCEKYDLGCWMNLRNDDIFCFRWGDPDYVREYMRNFPEEPIMAGYHMGSDGYVWGREFISKDPESPRQLEMDKHWYKFMLWGRLGYDPSLDRAFFEQQLKLRFPEVDSALLYETWQTASQIVLAINLAHWRDWDHMFSPEACTSKKEGYHTVDHFIQWGAFSGLGVQTVDQFVRNPDPNKRNLLQMADELSELGSRTYDGIEKMRSYDYPKELDQTLADIEAFSELATYYAWKIRGAVALHKYRVHGMKMDQEDAVKYLTMASRSWRMYADIASEQYENQLLARTSWLDWNGILTEYAQQDIEIARQAKHGEFPPDLHLSRDKMLRAQGKQ